MNKFTRSLPQVSVTLLLFANLKSFMSATTITHRNNVKVKGIGVISKTALLEDIDPDFSQVDELTVVRMGTQKPIQQYR